LEKQKSWTTRSSEGEKGTPNYGKEEMLKEKDDLTKGPCGGGGGQEKKEKTPKKRKVILNGRTAGQ